MRDMLYMIKRKFGAKEGLGKKQLNIGYVVVDKELDENGQEVEKRSVKTYTYNDVYDTAYNLGCSLIKRKLYH